MMLAEIDLDQLRAEMACWGPDDDEDDDEDENTPVVPVEPWEYDDDRRREVGTNDATRCPCPALAEYPPAGWLSLDAWETIDHLGGFPGVQVDGCNVWVPDDIGYEVSLQVDRRVRTWRTVFTPGEWYLFDSHHN